MLKCFVIVLCAITIVFCAPGYKNLREKQSARQEYVTNQLSGASRMKRQSLGTVEIVYVDAASIDPIKRKDLQSKESFPLAPVNDFTDPGEKIQQLAGNNLEVVTQNSNYIVYKLKTTGELPHDPPPEPLDHSPPRDDYDRYNYYNRPPPPTDSRSTYDDRSTRFYDDRRTRQSFYDRPPPPHSAGPPHDRGPPPRDGGRPPRYDGPSEYHRGPPPHHGGPPPRHGPPDRYDRGPPPRHGPPDRYDRGPPPPRDGPPDRYDHRPPQHHGGPPHRFDDRPPPHHGGPPHRFDDRPPPPRDRYDNRPPPPPDRYDDRPDRRPPPPPKDRRPPPNQDQGNGNNEYSKDDDHSTDVTMTSSTTEAETDDDQYQLDVRFNDDEQKPVKTVERDVSALPTARPLSSFIFQAAAVTPVD